MINMHRMYPLSRYMALVVLSILGSLCCTDSSLQAQDRTRPPNAHYLDGIRLFFDGQPALAIERLETFMQEQPESPFLASAAFHVAKAKTQMDPTNQEVYYNDFMNKFPVHEHTIDLLLDVAHRYVSEKKFEEGIRFYKRAAERGVQDKRAPQFWYWIAEAYIGLQNYDEAHRSYQQVVDQHPKSEWAPKAIFAQGSLNLQRQRYSQAAERFELLKAKYGKSQAARNIGLALGETYYRLGRYNAAIENLKPVQTTLDVEAKSKAIFLIAESYNAINDYENAARYYLQHVNLNEGKQDQRLAHYGLGWLYFKQKIYHWAAESFEKASKGDDELARKALYYKAVSEKVGGRYRESLETFVSFGQRYKEGLWIEEVYYEWALIAMEMGDNQQAIEIVLGLIRSGMPLKNKGPLFILLGEAYFANNEFTRAIQAYDAAAESTELDPNIKRQARFQKGWTMFREMAYQDAQPIFEALIKEDAKGIYSAEATFWNADTYFNLGKFDRAITQYQSFIKDFPKHELIGAARYSLGWAHFKMGQYDRAIEPFRAFLRDYKPPPVALYPYDADTHLRLGDAFFALRRYDEAIEAYSKVVDSKFGGEYATYQIGLAYSRAEKTGDAIESFRKIVRGQGSGNMKELAQYNIAYILMIKDQYAQSIAEFEELIRMSPRSEWAARAQYSIGDVYYNAEEYQKAIDAYQLLLKQYPSSPLVVDAISSIRDAKAAMGAADNTSQLVDDLLSSNPDAVTADRLRLSKAKDVMQMGNYDEAIVQFTDLDRLSTDPGIRAEAQFSLAEVYELKEDLQTAITGFQGVITQFPTNDRVPLALANMGRLQYVMKDFQGALQTYQALLEQHPKFREDALIGVGNAHLALGNIDQARIQFSALGASSNDKARIGLAKVDLEDGKFAEAEAVFSAIAKAYFSDLGADAQYHMGLTQQRAGRYEEAIKSYARLGELFDSYEEIVAKGLLSTSECYDRLNKPKESQATLRELIEKYPATEAGVSAQSKLDAMKR